MRSVQGSVNVETVSRDMQVSGRNSVTSAMCTCSFCVLKAKFHYALWSQTGPKLVADLLARASSLQVCDQLLTCLRPDSVMEFGLYLLP